MYIKLDAVTKVKTSSSISAFTKLPNQKRTVKDVNKSFSLCELSVSLPVFPQFFNSKWNAFSFLIVTFLGGLTDALSNVHGIQHNELLFSITENPTKYTKYIK